MPTLRRYLRSTGAILAFISETKCSREVAVRRIAGLPLQNSELVPSRGKGGGALVALGKRDNSYSS